MKNKTYDVIKYITLIFIPAVITLITSIAGLYNYDVTVYIGIISAFNVFLGSTVGIASKTYKDDFTKSLEEFPSIKDIENKNEG